MKRILTSEQKETAKLYQIEYRKIHGDKLKKQQKEFRNSNKEKIAERDKKYRLANRDRLLVKEKEKRSANKDNINKNQKEYFQNNPKAKEKKLIRDRLYAKNNRDKINTQRKLKRETDKLYRIKCVIRSLINNAITRYGFSKTSRTYDILGCSYEQFITHIESKFETWMTWKNYGLCDGSTNYGWDIDHIKPVISAKNEEEIMKLNHYTNLQPLCSYVNRNVKRDKF